MQRHDFAASETRIGPNDKGSEKNPYTTSVREIEKELSELAKKAIDGNKALANAMTEGIVWGLVFVRNKKYVAISRKAKKVISLYPIGSSNIPNYLKDDVNDTVRINGLFSTDMDNRQVERPVAVSRDNRAERRNRDRKDAEERRRGDERRREASVTRNRDRKEAEERRRGDERRREASVTRNRDRKEAEERRIQDRKEAEERRNSGRKVENETHAKLSNCKANVTQMQSNIRKFTRKLGTGNRKLLSKFKTIHRHFDRIVEKYKRLI